MEPNKKLTTEGIISRIAALTEEQKTKLTYLIKSYNENQQKITICCFSAPKSADNNIIVFTEDRKIYKGYEYQEEKEGYDSIENILWNVIEPISEAMPFIKMLRLVDPQDYDVFSSGINMKKISNIKDIMNDIIEMVEVDFMKEVFVVETLSPLAEHSSASDVLAHIIKHIVKNSTLVKVSKSSINDDYIIKVLYGIQLEFTKLLTPAEYKISEHCSGYMCTMEGGINVSHDYFIPYATEDDSVTAEFSASAYENGESPLIIIK